VLILLVAAFLHLDTLAQDRAGAAAIADAVVWGNPMPAADRTRELPGDVQAKLTDCRSRQDSFRSALKPSPNSTDDERAVFQMRVGVERVLVCLFPRRDIERVAASYASDADLSPDWENLAAAPRGEAAFIDMLLRDLPQPWLAPYLNLIAGHRKLCASQLNGSDTPAQRTAEAADARRQLARARDDGDTIIRVVAEHLLATGQCR